MSPLELIDETLLTILAITMYITLVIILRYGTTKLFQKIQTDYIETKYLLKQAVQSHKKHKNVK